MLIRVGMKKLPVMSTRLPYRGVMMLENMMLSPLISPRPMLAFLKWEYLPDHAEVEHPDAVADAHEGPEPRVDGDRVPSRHKHYPDEGEEEQPEEDYYWGLPLPEPVADDAHSEAANEARDGAEARDEPRLDVGQPLRLDEELVAPAKRT